MTHNVVDKIDLPNLKFAVNFSKIGLFILDKNMRIIYWGDGMERLFDVVECEVIGKHVLEKFPVLEKEGIYLKFIEAAKTGNSSELLAHKHKSQKEGIRFVDFNISPLRDEKKNIIGVNVLLNDVTDRNKEKNTLKEYEQFTTNILENAAEAIFTLDENDCIKIWNKQAAKMYGYNAADIIGKHISLIVPNEEKSQQEIMEINEIIKQKGFVKNWETERITVDGRKLLLRITRTAIRDEKGKYLGSSVIAHDITEQRRLEQQLIQSEKLSAVGQLAAGIVHEVGSPLTAISSLAQLLYEKSEDEWNKDKLRMIREQIDRISRIVREMVNFSKPISTTVGEVSVNKVIEEASQIVKYDKRLKHYKFSVDLSSHLPTLKISYDQLLQVLINILLNAGDALEGKKKGEVSVTSRMVGEKIIISIIDNGVGIKKENLDHIFEPFYTTKKPGKGTGLGLWVCYNIIKGFSGEIVVESEPNQGTAFHIFLPVFQFLENGNNE
ncbi:PAS domain S-box protein [candidate division KSB1 bacterium]|nr:PAS domain S-box protein [candidate division KSB1 bacterium]